MGQFPQVVASVGATSISNPTATRLSTWRALSFRAVDAHNFQSHRAQMSTVFKLDGTFQHPWRSVPRWVLTHTQVPNQLGCWSDSAFTQPTTSHRRRFRKHREVWVGQTDWLGPQAFWKWLWANPFTHIMTSAFIEPQFNHTQHFSNVNSKFTHSHRETISPMMATTPTFKSGLQNLHLWSHDHTMSTNTRPSSRGSSSLNSGARTIHIATVQVEPSSKL